MPVSGGSAPRECPTRHNPGRVPRRAAAWREMGQGGPGEKAEHLANAGGLLPDQEPKQRDAQKKQAGEI